MQTETVLVAGGGGFIGGHLVGDLLWGARTLSAIEVRWTEHLLDAWREGRSSLRMSLAEPAESIA